MAERASVRSTSRRTTPQSPPKSVRTENSMQQAMPSRTARITRSQSRDISDSDVERPVAKGRRVRQRQASADIVDSDAGVLGQGGRKGKQSARSRALQDLPTVKEDVSVVYPDVALADESTPHEPSNHGTVLESPGAFSAMSGTTAITSRSAQDIADFNPDDMIDALTDLSNASDRILRAFLPDEADETHISTIRREMQDPKSRTAKNVQRLGPHFERQSDPFSSEQYINPSIVARVLSGVNRVTDLGNGRWRPDAVMQKANFTKLLTTLLTFENLAEDVQEFSMRKLERDFPTQFSQELLELGEEYGISIGSSILLEETLDSAIELRTQYFIMLLTNFIDDSSPDPDELIKEVFYDDQNSLKGWNINGLRGGQLTGQRQKVIMGRIKEIRQTFPDDSESLRAGRFVDLEALRRKFPWSLFVERMMFWSRSRLQEIDIRIHEQGGTEGIIEALIDLRTGLATTNVEDTSSAEEKEDVPIEIHYQPPSESSNITSDQGPQPKGAAPGLRRSKVNGVSNFNSPVHVQHLKRTMRLRKAKQKAENVSRMQADPEEESLPAMEQDPAVIVPRTASKSTGGIEANRTIDVATSVPPKHASELLPRQATDDSLSEEDINIAVSKLVQCKALIDADNNKENLGTENLVLTAAGKKRSLLDPQKTASRVHWGSQQSSQGEQGPVEASRDLLLFSAPNDEGEELIEDVSEDEGFQQDTRFPEASRRTNVLSPSKRRGSGSAAQLTQSKKARRTPDEDDHHHLNDRRVTLSPRRGYSEGPELSQIDNYKMASQQAKQRTAMRPKRVQSRTAWSDVEEEKLIALIEQYGTSYALLKTKDKEDEPRHVLQHRDQVALKDKARNMKVNFLKSDVGLPVNWEHVVLGKKEIDKLRSLRIYYDRDRGTRRGTPGSDILDDY